MQEGCHIRRSCQPKLHARVIQHHPSLRRDREIERHAANLGDRILIIMFFLFNFFPLEGLNIRARHARENRCQPWYDMQRGTLYGVDMADYISKDARLCTSMPSSHQLGVPATGELYNMGRGVQIQGPVTNHRYTEPHGYSNRPVCVGKTRARGSWVTRSYDSFPLASVSLHR